MNTTFIHKINDAYFWDINIKTLDEIKSKRLIIERVANLGNLDEIKLLVNHYGKKELENTICNLNYLDPKTLNFLSLVFNIPKSNFKCFTRKQSKAQHWNF